MGINTHLIDIQPLSEHLSQSIHADHTPWVSCGLDLYVSRHHRVPEQHGNHWDKVFRFSFSWMARTDLQIGKPYKASYAPSGVLYRGSSVSCYLWPVRPQLFAGFMIQSSVSPVSGLLTLAISMPLSSPTCNSEQTRFQVVAKLITASS